MIDQIQPGSVATIPEGESVKNPRLQGILRYWTEKRGDGAMPSFRQIDPVEIPKLLPIILVADVHPSGITIRLLGTDATNAYGREMRGRGIGELAFGDFLPFWLEAFQLVVSSGKPTAASGPYRSRMELLDADLVLMPMSDDGRAITQILGGLLIRPAPCMATTMRQPISGILAAGMLSRSAS